MTRSKLKEFASLHMLLVLYSLTDLFGKIAAGFPFDDVRFFISYGAVLVVLFIYAIGWQQLIKRLPLTTAFASKAITVFWGLVWGVLFFQEALTPLKITGALIVVLGVVMFSRADDQETREANPAAPLGQTPPSDTGKVSGSVGQSFESGCNNAVS